jgi:hypothetical protein
MGSTVLYPQGPLLIVDRGMRRKTKLKSYETCISDEKDIKISVYRQERTRSDAHITEAGQRPRRAPAKAVSSNIRFVLSEPNKRKKVRKYQSETTARCDPQGTKQTKVALLEDTGRLTPPSSDTDSSSDIYPLSRSTPLSPLSPIYLAGADHGIDAASLTYLPYCTRPPIIAKAQY